MSEQLALSVLLPVHRGVVPEHLRACLDSVYAQTYPAQEVIVVEDGPLGDGHQAVLDSFVQAAPVMRRVKLEHNRGAGVANQAGLSAARCEWIAKMDADDVCLPERFRKQADFIRTVDVDVCGTTMIEFVDTIDQVRGIRAAVPTHAGISRRMRMNNAMNHSTTMYRRELAVEVGGYSELRYMQDYDLFARMIVAGARFANLQEPLVAFRADDGMFGRRSSRAMDACEWRLQHNLRDYGLFGTSRMWLNLMARSGFRRLPRPLMLVVYGLLFRRGRAPTTALSPAVPSRCESGPK